MRGYLLGWGSLCLNVSIDEDAEVVCSSVDVFLSLGDGQLGHQLIEHLCAV